MRYGPSVVVSTYSVRTAERHCAITVASATPSIPMPKGNDKQKIEHGIDNSGKNQEIQRMAGIADSAENAGAHVVENIRPATPPK